MYSLTGLNRSRKVLQHSLIKCRKVLRYSIFRVRDAAVGVCAPLASDKDLCYCLQFEHLV